MDTRPTLGIGAAIVMTIFASAEPFLLSGVVDQDYVIDGIIPDLIAEFTIIPGDYSSLWVYMPVATVVVGLLYALPIWLFLGTIIEKFASNDLNFSESYCFALFMMMF